MAEQRYKDSVWNIGQPLTVAGGQLAVLMDIRDELKAIKVELGIIRGVINCANCRDIPKVLRTIRANTSRIPKGKP